MNIMIGFGSTEKTFEEDEEQAIREFAIAEFKRLECQFVSDEFVKSVQAWCETRAQGLRDQADEYNTSDTHPDRYSYYWPRVVSGASDIVVILSMSHINRRHALSPDGWALMQTSRLVHVSTLDDLR